MADKKYNLDSIISKYIHRPIVKSKGAENSPPLYARVGNESESKLDLAAAKNPVWVQAVAVRYNSPTNVRRLFIGDSRVTIQYYQPPFSANSSDKSCWATYSMDEEDILSNLADKSANYNQLVMDAAMAGAGRPDRVVLTKSGLGAVASDWKMSNLEEIYITPNILQSTDIKERFSNIEKVWALLRSNPIGKMYKDELPLRIFEIANGDNIKNIRNRFPRLRMVAFATELDTIMELPGAKGLRDGLPKETSDAGVYWLQYMLQKDVKNHGSFMISEVPGDKNTDRTLEFITRPGIYKYDAEILESYCAKYKEKLLELKRKNRDDKIGLSKRDEVAEKKEKSEYEKYLDSLSSTHNESFIQSVIQLAFARVKAAEIDEIFNEMSDEGKKKYRAMLGR